MFPTLNKQNFIPLPHELAYTLGETDRVKPLEELSKIFGGSLDITRIVNFRIDPLLDELYLLTLSMESPKSSSPSSSNGFHQANCVGGLGILLTTHKTES